MASLADNSPYIQPVCQNCSTSTTPLWRRDESGSVLCNACGLFLKLHGRPRPISLKTDVIKSRNRVKATPNGHGKRSQGVEATGLQIGPPGHYDPLPTRLLRHSAESATRRPTAPTRQSRASRPLDSHSTRTSRRNTSSTARLSAQPTTPHIHIHIHIHMPIRSAARTRLRICQACTSATRVRAAARPARPTAVMARIPSTSRSRTTRWSLRTRR